MGLSISGGDIRSATFALGVIQELSRKGILRQVDYLSTVSGGGYLGAFISSFLNYAVPEAAPSPQAPLDPESSDLDKTPELKEGLLRAKDKISLRALSGELPFGADKDLESQGVRELRNHSKYLTEGGVRTLATIVGVVGYGVLTSILLLAPFLLLAALVAARVFGKYFDEPSPFLPLSLLTEVLIVVFAVGVLLLPLIQKLSLPNRWKAGWGSFCLVVASLCVVSLAIESLPKLLQVTSYIGGPSVLFFSIVAAPFVIGALGG